jgi:glycosyltransferase A (GT-A) superfamily protein (DUF2064 family)
VRPALLLLAGDLDRGVPGLTDDAAEADALLGAALDLARATGGVGRVLLFHPWEAEAPLTARALGFRLWPAEGDTEGARWANAFRQASDLGYEGAVVLRLDAAHLPAARLNELVERLATSAAVVIPDDAGGIVAVGLQRPEPGLVPPGSEVPTVEVLATRARQLRVPLCELAAHPRLAADGVAAYLASRA